jgi:hypothetical protein
LTSRFPCSFPEEISARKIFGCITVPTARIYPRARVHLTSLSALRTLLLVGRMRRRSLKYLLHLLTRGSAATSRSPFPMQPLRRVLRFRLYHGNTERRALISTLYLEQVLTRFSRGRPTELTRKHTTTTSVLLSANSVRSSALCLANLELLWRDNNRRSPTSHTRCLLEYSQ